MKYVRFSRNGESRYGILDGNKIAVLNGDLFGEHEESGEVVDLDAVKLLAPCLPSKIMCAGTNYMSHIIECREKMNLDVSIPEHPLIFSKGPNTIADPEQGVIYPTGVNRVDFEGELDTFCPMGPIITDEIDAFNSRVITRVNGEVLQDGNSNDLIFDIPALIEYISEWITLEAGDVIATGTPAGVAPVKVGDVIEIEIPGIGILRNTMI